jgi:hypothetical protein
MPIQQFGFARQRSAVVIPVRFPHIVREPGAEGWLVILGSYGWAYGSRRDALGALRELASEARP